MKTINAKRIRSITGVLLLAALAGIPSSCLFEQDPCSSIVCENGGACVGEGTCVCNDLYTGDRCQTALDQIWELRFLDGGETPHFQVIQVQITSFTNSGTFSELPTSPGLWMFDSSGANCYRLHVEGNIVRDSPGDRWSFAGMAGSGCGMQTFGTNSSGTANANFPYATGLTNGLLTLTTQSASFGTASGEVRWWGIKL